MRTSQPFHSRLIRRSGSLAIASVFAITGLLAGALLTGTFESSPLTIAAVPQDLPKVTPGSTQDSNAGFSHIVPRVLPAIVNITATASSTNTRGSSPSPFDFEPFGPDSGQPGWNDLPRSPLPLPPGPPRGMGSGVIVSPDGYIVTNHHVIAGAEDVTVTLTDKREFTGRVIGSDPQSDLAVIKINATKLPYLTWGDSDRLEVGEYVLAIGNPFGLNSTVTQGIISGLGRGGMGITQYEDFIQTDAAINPGNSGGALVNMRGELVGINTAILSRTGGSQGVGFAISASMGQHVYESLVKHGKVARGYLGVGIQALTPDLATALHLENSSGALVTDVKEHSPADKAGIRQGDTIVEYQGVDVLDPRSLQGVVTRTHVGEKVSIAVMRDGSKVLLSTTIEEHPDTRQVAARAMPSEELGLAGLRVTELTPRLAARLKLDDQAHGVIVESVRPNSQAARAGLRRGDVISEINRQRVDSLHTYQQVVSDLQQEQPVLLLVNRQGMTVYLTVRV